MKRLLIAVIAAVATSLATAGPAAAQVSVNVEQRGATTPVQLLLLFALLAFLPGMVFAVTAFPRILITLGFLRSALGTPSIPPNQVLVGIAMFLTLFVMAPTVNQIRTDAVQPYLDKKITQEQAFERGQEPLRTFMFKQTREKDLALFVNLSGAKERPATRADIPTHVLIPAFMLSELKTAFQIGFMIYIPFVIIDLVVASVLLSMGMMMLPPPLISLAFKILLFVLVDGWHLVFEALVNSFNP